MTYKGEDAFYIPVGDDQMATIFHPAAAAPHAGKVGCLILVGGPQYRVGAHRFYTELARHLASRGIAALRVDYLGMGDSTGAQCSIEARGAEIAAATDALCERLDPEATIIPWGLCEGASAILLHQKQIPQMTGAVLANPWVGDESIEAKVKLRHQYSEKIKSPEFWKRLASGKVNIKKAAIGVTRSVKSGSQKAAKAEDQQPSSTLAAALRAAVTADLPLLYLASGQDRERQAFDFAIDNEAEWAGLANAESLYRFDLAEADHTFSKSTFKKCVFEKSSEFITQVVSA